MNDVFEWIIQFLTGWFKMCFRIVITGAISRRGMWNPLYVYWMYPECISVRYTFSIRNRRLHRTTLSSWITLISTTNRKSILNGLRCYLYYQYGLEHLCTSSLCINWNCNLFYIFIFDDWITIRLYILLKLMELVRLCVCLREKEVRLK